jgi:uncharacterized SAM-binding protein YcdF (DUF218 family)
MTLSSSKGQATPSKRRIVARRVAWTLAACVLAFAAMLPFAGRLLVAEDPLRKADAIVVLSGAPVERWLEAADLYHEGFAPRLVLSPGRTDYAARLARDRGIHLMTEAEIVRDALGQLRVPQDAVIVMPGSMDNTADEAHASRVLAEQNGWTRLIVVTSKYHSRRTRFAFRREFRDTRMAIIVRPSRYDEANPARWWRSRNDIRSVVYESEKLLLYRLGLGR